MTPIAPQPVAVPAKYRALHKYLKDRYADTVFLTFGQIEDLLGFTLPDAACQAEWWANENPPESPSSQSLSWTQAGRTATPRVLARAVAFDRAPG